MCELFGLSGRMPTRVTLSLEAFARHGGFTGDAVDGWGVAFYDGTRQGFIRNRSRRRTASGCASSKNGASPPAC